MGDNESRSLWASIEEANTPWEAAGIIGGLSVYSVAVFPLKIAGKVANLVADKYYDIASGERPLVITTEELDAARRDPRTKKFLEEAFEQDRRLRERGLIHD